MIYEDRVQKFMRLKLYIVRLITKQINIIIPIDTASSDGCLMRELSSHMDWFAARGYEVLLPPLVHLQELPDQEKYKSSLAS